MILCYVKIMIRSAIGFSRIHYTCSQKQVCILCFEVFLIVDNLNKGVILPARLKCLEFYML